MKKRFVELTEETDTEIITYGKSDITILRFKTKKDKEDYKKLIEYVLSQFKPRA